MCTPYGVSVETLSNCETVVSTVTSLERQPLPLWHRKGEVHQEGRWRNARYVHGAFIDLHYYGVLEQEWRS